MTALKPGVQAPDFSLPTTPDQKGEPWAHGFQRSIAGAELRSTRAPATSRWKISPTRPPAMPTPFSDQPET